MQITCVPARPHIPVARALLAGRQRQQLPAQGRFAESRSRAAAPLRPLVACRSNLGGSGGYGSDEEDDEDDQPIELSVDPREFRARLVAQEQKGEGDAASVAGDEEEGWVYETPLLETGAVLLGSIEQSTAFGLRQQYFHKCVVLALSHEDRFTKGVIVNKPTLFTVKDLYIEGISSIADDWPVWCGGDVQTGGLFDPPATSVGAMQIKNTQDPKIPVDVSVLFFSESGGAPPPDSLPVVEGVVTCTLEEAVAWVEAGQARQEDFWVFVGYAGWGGGQLQGELDRGCWYMASADSGLVLKELLLQRADPEALPRLAPGDGGMLAGGDGLGTWERLSSRLGKVAPAAGGADAGVDDAAELHSEILRFGDAMLREWVRERLTGVAAREGYEGDMLAPAPLARGDVLVACEPECLDRQYLNKSLMLVLDSTDDVIVCVCLNRPTGNTVGINPDPEGRDGEIPEVRRRVMFGGDAALGGIDESAFIMLQCGGFAGEGREPMGDSGCYLVRSSQYDGRADRLLMCNGLLLFNPPGLGRAVAAGRWSKVPRGGVSWADLAQLADAGSAPESIPPTLASGGIAGEGGAGFNPARAKRAEVLRIASKGDEAWREAMRAVGREEPSGPRAELADEALGYWNQQFFGL